GVRFGFRSQSSTKDQTGLRVGKRSRNWWKREQFHPRSDSQRKMSGPAISTLLAMAIQVVLGLTVFFAHPKRRSNQCFLILSLAICGWIGSLLLAFTAKTEPVAELAIREASAAAALIFAAFNLLRLSISDRQKDWSHILARSRTWLIVTTGIVYLCQTKFFLQAARMPANPNHDLAVPI